MKQILAQALVLVPILWLHGVASMIALAVFLLMSLNSVANTSMSRSAMQRLNELMPQIFPNTGGIVNGSVTVTGNHAVNGQIRAGGATGSATLEVGGNAHVTSTLEVDGGVTMPSLGINATGGATLEVGGNAHITSTLEIDGNTTISQVNGQALPMSTVSRPSLTSPSANEVSLASAINGLIARMQSVNYIS